MICITCESRLYKNIRQDNQSILYGEEAKAYLESYVLHKKVTVKLTGKKTYNRHVGTIEPILSSEYPTLAKRPAYSVLDKSKIKRELGVKIPYWKESLCECIRELLEFFNI